MKLYTFSITRNSDNMLVSYFKTSTTQARKKAKSFENDINGVTLYNETTNRIINF